jgi:uncharacterized protein (TIGR02271 family)
VGGGAGGIRTGRLLGTGGGGGVMAVGAGAAAGAAGTAAAGGRHARPGRSADTSAAKNSGVDIGAGSAGYAAGRTGPAERLSADAAARGDEAESMIRSEEEMDVHVERRAAGRARLHKYVEVEEVEETVPVRREEVRLEREPITDATRSGLPATEITEAEQVVTLHEEQPVVDARVVPKERVRMRVEEHTEQRTVHGRVRKERIETDTTGVAETGKGTRETGRGRPDDRYR